MATKRTEQNIKSEDAKILKELTMADVYDFLQQMDGEKRRAVVLLEKQYEDAISDSKTSHLSRQFLLDRGFGKAKQAVDITSGGEKMSTGVIIEWEDSNNEKI